MSAACVAVSAFAVENQKVAPVKRNIAVGEAVQKSADPVKAVEVAEIKASDVSKRIMKVGENTGFVNFMPADNLMSIGMNPEGSAYRGLGFASSYGSLDFYNLSTNVDSCEWNYADLNDYEIVDKQYVWNIKTSKAENLSIKSGIGEVMVPELNAKIAGSEVQYGLPVTQEYLCGGSSRYWMGVDDNGDVFGLTFYQNVGLKNGKGYDGGLTYKVSYQPGAEGYNENGVYVNPENKNNWEAAISKKYPDSTVTNLKLNNFSIIQPKPASTYFITEGWIWMNVTATAATQLISYIYPITEEGLSENPIAIGYASIAEGESDMPRFEYYPLNEDGDEVEGETFIDTAVLITIEGFAGNELITDVTPLSGYYPFSYEEYSSGNYDIMKGTDILLNISFEVDGEPVTSLVEDTGLYSYGGKDDNDTVSSLSYAMFMTDATYAFIIAANGEETVNIASTGGSVDVDIDALYYEVASLMEEGVYEVSAPEWLNVSFSQPNEETYLTTMTVSAEASEEGRTGIVSIEGLGATFSLTVVQGDGGNAVNVVVSDKNAEYFDLAGRRVANPEKGIYIKKSGNKAEKVIF